MMKRKFMWKPIIMLLGLLPAFTFVGSAAASDTGTVHVTGNLLAGSCSVTGGTDLTFNLAPVSTGGLPNVNSTAGRTEQSLNLSCDEDTTVYMTVTGTSVADNPTVIASTGSAQGVGLQLLDVTNNNTPITLGARWMVINQTGTTTAIPLAAQYIRTGSLTSGTVKATVTYTLDYQ